MATGAEVAEAYDTLELQARTNLLVNDEGFNLPPGSSFNSITPDINDAAQVAFRVQYTAAEGNPSSGAPGIWFGGDGTGSIVHRGTESQSVPNDVSLNEAGDIAFTFGDGALDNALFRYDGAAGTVNQVGTSPVLPSSYNHPVIDEEGDITFGGTFGSGRAWAGVEDAMGVYYVQDSSLDPDSPFGYLYTPRGNDAAQIAGKVGLESNISTDVEIRVFEADGTSQLMAASTSVDETSAYSRFDNSVGLSDNGLVAAIATRAADGTKVVLRLDGTTATEVAVAGEDGIESFDFFAPDINDAGQVVFRAVDATGQAVYVADGETVTRVVGKGDEVQTDNGLAQLGQHDGSPVFGGAPRINNLGDVSFTAGVHPAGDNQVEWGSGVFVAYAGDQVPPEPEGPETVERLSGFNRFATAANAALSVYPEGAEVVYIATGRAFPDALTATAPAGHEDGPVLLTEADRIPLDTRTALEALTPAEIIVTGGSGAVSDDVLAALEQFTDGPVTRISGVDRYGTAAALAARFETPETVFVATGLDYPDALAAGARAGAVGAPVLLVRQDGVPVSTRAALESLTPGNIVVVGGDGSVADEVLTALEAYTTGEVTRVSGTDRYATAAALSEGLTTSEFGFVATGQDWPDALGAAALAGHLGSPVLLVKADELPAATSTELERLEPPHLRVLGGTAVIQESVKEALEALDYTDE
ncbi:cell wall-binding repeat-containing protein [Ornithinimicrobium sp. F0845]|uniref:cell wall-binding repeat-containing protein n=1 Tax=Ornithinimicrobium sp. F0845 TaxID=2926412 RepID=UPI001FF5E493|nr:cell wall-binding repeat-containing protein [Ornithinimicrobium sp. F0845]